MKDDQFTNMKKCLTFTWDASAAQDPILEFTAIKGFWLLGASYCPQSHTGTPTNSILTVQDDTVAVTGFALTVTTAGTPTTVKTTGIGGTVALPAHIDADSVVGLKLAFTAGTSPTAVDAVVVLWIDEDE
jgi:hypothetical protein